MIAAIASLDTSVLTHLYALRTFPATLAFIWVSEFGAPLTVIGLAVCAALLMRHQWQRALGILIAVGGSGVAMEILKHVIARPRPPHTFQAYLETGYSFPSGHTTGAMALYGFLWWLAWKHMAPGRTRTLVLALLPILIVAVGFSRLYLGVHYLSDVLGGFALGAVFIWIGIAITRWLEQRAPRS